MKTGLRLLLLLGLLVLILVGAAALYEWYDCIPADAQAKYVGGASCIECHKEQHELFHGSHHDLAMDVANEQTVLANFDGSEIEHYGVTSTTFKSGDRYMVNTESADGSMQDFEVKYVFGVEPLQQYMVETKASDDPEAIGQLQVLRLCWDVNKAEWFYLSPWDVDEKIEPDDPLHWTGITQRWNTNCAECHSTNLQKNYDLLSKTYSTTFTDIDVNCEACHGPASLHVEIADKRRFFWDRNRGYGLVNLKTTSNLPQVEMCAPCHSRRAELFHGHEPNKRFDDHFACQLISDGIYHDDGQIREEDYVYGSFTQSKMFHRGIRCTDCHDPHTAKVKFNDNQLCTSCHQHPAGKYDSPSHHRHQTGSTGALCVECHMPATTYMDVDPRRDHSLRVPRPDLSVEFGTPNACTACHIDKEKLIGLPKGESRNLKQYLDWLVSAKSGNTIVATELDRVNQQMADAFKEWYPDAASNPKRSMYYEQLTKGKAGQSDSPDILKSLALDRSAPAIFRASALESGLRLADHDFSATGLSALKDSDPKVVAAALRILDRKISNIINDASYRRVRTDATREIRKLIRPINALLDHSSRRVRLETARVIANIPGDWRSELSGTFDRQLFEKSLDDYKTSIRAISDRGENHAVLATMYEMEGAQGKAESAYRTAIAVDKRLTGPRTNLAAIIDRQAEELRDRIIRSPKSNQNIALGKKIDDLTAEALRLRTEENQLLSREIERAGDLAAAHDVHYRYGLSCYLMGKPELAEKHLNQAYEFNPSTENYALAMATFHFQEEEYAKALKYSKALLQLAGENPGYQRLHEQILSKIPNDK